MIYYLICHQNKTNNEFKYCLRNCKPQTPCTQRECVCGARYSVCRHTGTHTCTQTHLCHRSSCSGAASAIILISKEVGIKAYKDYILPLVVCKTALGGCMHLERVCWLLWCPPHWSQASCWVGVACLLQTNPHRLYPQVNIGKENSKGCVGFCWSFLTKSSYMELENRWILYHTKKSNLSLMKGFIDLQKFLAWSWFPFYRWGSWDRERWIHLSKVTQQVNDDTRKQIQIV